LSLFGHTSTADRLDTHSQFQRPFSALGVAHRVAPNAPAKGKIERRFDTRQNRLVTLLAYEKITDYPPANALLRTQIARHNAHDVCRTTGLTPNATWDLALQEKRNHPRPAPATPLLDLHLALYLQRRFLPRLPRQQLAPHPRGQQTRDRRPSSPTMFLGHSSAPIPPTPSGPLSSPTTARSPNPHPHSHFDPKTFLVLNRSRQTTGIAL